MILNSENRITSNSCELSNNWSNRCSIAQFDEASKYPLNCALQALPIR